MPIPFLIGPALFVLGVGVPAVFGRRAQLPAEALAGFGYKVVCSGNGYPSGESPFSPRFNDGGVAIAKNSSSPLGKQLFEFSEVYQPLELERGRTYHFTLSEGMFLTGLVNTACTAWSQRLQAKDDLEELRDSIPPVNSVPPDQLPFLQKMYEDAITKLEQRIKTADENWRLAMDPIAVYLKQRESRLKQYPW